MTHLQDGRSDALRRLAGPSSHAVRRRRSRATIEKHSAAQGAGPIEQDPVEALARAGRADQKRPVFGGRRERRDRVKVAAVPLLSLVGVLLLIPAAWAVLLLAGAPVWHHEREGASGMAVVMLICGPISLAMFSGAAYYHAKLRGHGHRS